MVTDNVTVGLQVWLLFGVVFSLLGYSPGFSILLGAIAGFASNVIAKYVNAKIQVPPSAASDSDKESPLKQAQNRLRQWRSNRNEKRKLGSSRRGLLSRKPRRSLKSRR